MAAGWAIDEHPIEDALLHHIATAQQLVSGYTNEHVHNTGAEGRSLVGCLL